jgi:hypothetical protein
MSAGRLRRRDVALRPWASGDEWLLQRLLGEPDMMGNDGRLDVGATPDRDRRLPGPGAFPRDPSG